MSEPKQAAKATTKTDVYLLSKSEVYSAAGDTFVEHTRINISNGVGHGTFRLGSISLNYEATNGKMSLLPPHDPKELDNPAYRKILLKYLLPIINKVAKDCKDQENLEFSYPDWLKVILSQSAKLQEESAHMRT